MERLKFIIRADGSESIGLGHLNRCKLLADALRSLGAPASLAVSDDPAARAFLGEEQVIYLDTDDCRLWPTADACIVDQYRYNVEYYAMLKKCYPHLAMFDDNEYVVPSGVGAVINPNVHASPEAYPDDVARFVGAEYYLLRKEFLAQKRRSTRESIFLCMGGSDPEKQTGRLLEILLSATERPIVVVLGPGADGSEVNTFPLSPRVSIHKAPADIADIMSEAVFAVCASGSMLYELAFFGIPTACLSLAENQVAIGQAFAERKASRYLGHFSVVSNQRISEELRLMESEPALQAAISQNCRTMIDGQGADRLASQLMHWLKREKSASCPTHEPK